MNVSVNLYHVLGLAYALGAVHHFFNILKYAMTALKRDRGQISDRHYPAFCFLLTACVFVLSVVWPLTAAISLSKKGG